MLGCLFLCLFGGVFVCFFNLTQARVTCEEGTSTEKNASIRLTQIEQLARLGGTFLISEDPAQCGGIITEQVVLGCPRKQVEQTMASKPVSSVPHGLCFSSCLHVLALTSLNDGLRSEIYKPKLTLSSPM